MIYVELFWNFLMIGALSFGGGYGMISLVRETVLGHGWLTEGEFLSFIAVSESTPGPLAINMALSTLLGFAGRSTDFVPDARSIAVFVLLWALHLLCRKRNGKAPSPILMILISAGLGILFWGA